MCFFFLVACCSYWIGVKAKKKLWMLSPPLVCTLLNSEEYVLDCWVHSLSLFPSPHLHSPPSRPHHITQLTIYIFFGTGTIYGVIDKVKPPPPHYWLSFATGSIPIPILPVLWLWDHCCYYKLLSCLLVLFSFHFCVQTTRTTCSSSTKLRM